MTIPELVTRIEMLRQRKLARRRGDGANVRTISTQARKRLRGLLAEGYDGNDPDHRAAAHLLGTVYGGSADACSPEYPAGVAFR